jgi:hypothetical protein
MPDADSPPAAVLLFSGGLDSCLACEVLLRAGVDVVVLRHYSVFFPLSEGGSYRPDCRVVTRDVTDDMIRLVAAPQYGFGSNANPCLDCKQMMYGRAWAEAERQGAGFIATGEVLGQRPMSQRVDAFRRMEKGAGVEGLVVRPLSGKLLDPTIPEERGLIGRDDLLDICGRSRKRQMALAAEWGITDYPTPAGGCKLTDPQYAKRTLRLREMGLLRADCLRAVRHGRFYPLNECCFVLVGRNYADNQALLADAPAGSTLLEIEGKPGPLACLVGDSQPADAEEAARLVIRHSRFRDLPAEAVRSRPAVPAGDVSDGEARTACSEA